MILIQEELVRLIDRMGAYLRQGLGRDLPERLARLEASSAGAATLALLDRIITRRGLVELRPLLDQLVRRLESPQFEVAVFGRVSSGKSSLLNHLVGVDVLPVGVTPVTAVPTRLVRGGGPAVLVSFAEMEPRTVPVAELRNYASEEGNPGNRKHVTGIRVEVPSPRLPDGVVLVDTPGIGSLARSGGAETLVYLPRCDLGVVLIDAASTLTPDDLDLLRLLYEAAVPAQVVLSKADLPTPEDRQRTAGYIRAQLRQELGLDLPVYPVSTVAAEESLLTRWFEHEVEPLLTRHRALAEASMRRRIENLRESVAAALETILARQQAGAAAPTGPAPRGGGAQERRVDVSAARELLEGADEAVRQARDRCRDWVADESALLEIILHDAAQAAVSSAGPAAAAVFSAVRKVLLQRDQTAHGLVTELRQKLFRTLESLRRAVAQATPEPTAVHDLEFRDLPPVDLQPWEGRLPRARAWWAPFLPGVAVWAARRAIERQLGPALREQVELHDRQLRAWLKRSVGRLVEQYEEQAEVFRQQLALLTSDGTVFPAAGEAQELEADLQELRPSEADEAVRGGRG